jgi:hypothetical protein
MLLSSENAKYQHLGNDFLRRCMLLEIVNLPKLRVAGHCFLFDCTLLRSVTFPSLQIVGVCCLSRAKYLRCARFPALTVVWGWLLETLNNNTTELDLYFGSEITTWGSKDTGGTNDGVTGMLKKRCTSEDNGPRTVNLYLCQKEYESDRCDKTYQTWPNGFGPWQSINVDPVQYNKPLQWGPGETEEPTQ